MDATGATSFDFLLGHWKVRNRRLVDHTNPECEEWVEFDARSEVVKVLQGYGNVDRFFVPGTAHIEAFEGFTLRIFDPSVETWRIWWSSSRSPGVLDPPVEGRFDGDLGVFQCHDVINGASVEVRFEWSANKTTPTWRQSFSWDAGTTWKLNWIMTFEFIDEAND